jgi:hypothetical protein
MLDNAPARLRLETHVFDYPGDQFGQVALFFRERLFD